MRKTILLAFAITALLVISCRPKEEAQPEKTPQIIRVNDASYGSYGPGQDLFIQTVTNYNYDAQGNRLSSAMQSTRTLLKDNSKEEFSSNISYEYNAEGFLVKETNGATVTTHEYADGRLAKTTQGTTVTTYGYNAAGLLTTTEIRNSGQLSVNTAYEYTDGKLSKRISTFSDGRIASTGYITNAQGLVEREILSSSFENRYQYDTEGQLVRAETWRDGQASGSFRTYQYDNQKILPFRPKFKGHTDIQAFFGKSVHNLTKQIVWSVDASGVEKESYSEVYEYQYNGKGYPVLRKYGKNETTYTYQDIN